MPLNCRVQDGWKKIFVPKTLQADIHHLRLRKKHGTKLRSDFAMALESQRPSSNHGRPLKTLDSE